MRCMLLAAGLGTRLRPITNQIPKPAVEVLNVPLFLYATEWLEGLSADVFVANVHHLENQVKAVAQRSGLNFQFSVEKEKVLGSGGGIKFAQKLLEQGRGPILTLNADNVIVPGGKNILKNLLAAHEASPGALATLLTVEDARVGHEFNGIWFNKNNELCEVAKKPLGSGLQGFHFTGVAVYSPKIFDYLPEGESNIFQDALLPALARGEKVRRYSAKLSWFETGDPQNYLRSTKALLHGFEANQFIQRLVQKHSPSSVFIRDGENIALVASTLLPDVSLRGFNVIGHDVQIPAKTKIENSVILCGARVSTSAISNQIIL